MTESFNYLNNYFIFYCPLLLSVVGNLISASHWKGEIISFLFPRPTAMPEFIISLLRLEKASGRERDCHVAGENAAKRASSWRHSTLVTTKRLEGEICFTNDATLRCENMWATAQQVPIICVAFFPHRLFRCAIVFFWLAPVPSGDFWNYCSITKGLTLSKHWKPNIWERGNAIKAQLGLVSV